MVLCGLRCLKVFLQCCVRYLVYVVNCIPRIIFLLLFAFANSIHNPMFKKHIVQFRKIEKKRTSNKCDRVGQVGNVHFLLMEWKKGPTASLIRPWILYEVKSAMHNIVCWNVENKEIILLCRQRSGPDTECQISQQCSSCKMRLSGGGHCGGCREVQKRRARLKAISVAANVLWVKTKILEKA